MAKLLGTKKKKEEEAECLIPRKLVLTGTWDLAGGMDRSRM